MTDPASWRATDPVSWWAHEHSPGQLLCHLELSQSNPGDFRVIIDRADPLIWISADTVNWAAAGKTEPRITLTPAPARDEDDNWTGSVIRFRADNRDVLYRLTSQHGDLSARSPENNGRLDLGYYVAKWPD